MPSAGPPPSRPGRDGRRPTDDRWPDAAVTPPAGPGGRRPQDDAPQPTTALPRRAPDPGPPPRSPQPPGGAPGGSATPTGRAEDGYRPDQRRDRRADGYQYVDAAHYRVDPRVYRDPRDFPPPDQDDRRIDRTPYGDRGAPRDAREHRPLPPYGYRDPGTYRDGGGYRDGGDPGTYRDGGTYRDPSGPGTYRDPGGPGAHRDGGGYRDPDGYRDPRHPSGDPRRRSDRPYDRPDQSDRSGDYDRDRPRDPYDRDPFPQRSPARGGGLPPYRGPDADGAQYRTDAPDERAPTGPGPEQPATGPRTPRKLTVTRVAAMRSRELTTRGVQLFQRAATADGADRSGLTHLTYAVMANYAVDAAVAVALANTLFFAAATAESTGKVLLYLLITVAPFAVIAPLIGPALDRLQRGRRIALAASSFGRALLALILAFNFHSWVLYPCALGMLVLSKSFGVLKAALTPRVLPEQITLVKTNSRLTVFGMVAGGVSGAVAAGLAAVSTSMGVLIFTAAVGVVGGLLCLRIPAWVESTEGEIPVATDGSSKGPRPVFPPGVVTALWANGTIRVETGFLALFIAFVVKSEFSHTTGLRQLGLLGAVGAAAGLGGFVGNALGARLPLTKPEMTAILSLAVVLGATVVAALGPGLFTAVLLGFLGSTCSSLAKVCLDSSIQHALPEASRASAFGRSESVLQLCWVFGGVVGLLLGGVWHFPRGSIYTIGFGVLAVFLVIGFAQCWLLRAGKSAFGWVRLPRRKADGGAGPAGTTKPPGRKARRKAKDGMTTNSTATRGQHGVTDPMTMPSTGSGGVAGPAAPSWTPADHPAGDPADRTQRGRGRGRRQ